MQAGDRTHIRIVEVESAQSPGRTGRGWRLRGRKCERWYFEISNNGELVSTIIARLAVRLGDVWVTLVKTTNVEYIYKS